MNHRSENLMYISQAITGFINHKMAEGLSPRTVASYERLLYKWIEHRGDQPIDEVSSKNILEYMSWLRTDYKPVRFNKEVHPLSRKTVRNIYMKLASFFRWASIEFDIPNPIESVPAPKIQKKPVDPFTQEDVESLVKACEFSRKADTHYRMSFVMRRPTAKRDRALILLLLDTGLRASEVCALRVEHVDLKTGRIDVAHGVGGGAKGGKGRTVYLGKVDASCTQFNKEQNIDGFEPNVSTVKNSQAKMWSL